MLLEDGNHGNMMTKGYVYKCLKIEEEKECPYTFSSDYGEKEPYSITRKTFETCMAEMSYEEATTKTLRMR